MAEGLECSLPRSLRLGPSRFCSSGQGGFRGSRNLPLGLRNSFSLSGHSLRNPGSNVGQALRAHLPAGFGAFDFGPAFSCGSSNCSSAGCAHFPLFGCLGSFGRNRNFTTQNAAQFTLQRLDPFLEVGCFSQLARGQVNNVHMVVILEKDGWMSSRRTTRPTSHGDG